MNRVQYSMRIEPEGCDDELIFASQLGFDGVYTWLRDSQLDYDFASRLREKAAKKGLKLFTAQNYRLCKNTAVQLGWPESDRVIEEYRGLLFTLGKAGIPSTNFTWEPVNTYHWNHPEPSLTRGAVTRHIDLSDIKRRPLLFDREYPEEELWENYRHFIENTLPAAEEAGVDMALHPNDPPVAGAGGVAFLIKSRGDYVRALSYRESKRLGMEFCAGCWLEGGKAFGDVGRDFEYFAADDRIFVVHFRNVSAPLPVFDESFLDNGYMDMYELAKTIAASGYGRSLILDHVPQMLESYGKGASLAYNMGFLKALFDRAYDNLPPVSNHV